MYSYADVIEMKRANVRNYAFVRRVIEMKQMIVNYFVRRELCLHSDANAKLRLRLVVVFSSVREELKAEELINAASLFLVGAFINKRARILQSLVFFFFFKTDSNRRTFKINVQLLITVLNYWTGKRGAHLG